MKKIRFIASLSLIALLAGGAGLAQAQQVQARVISTSPVTLPNGSIAYNVTYEYAGQQYSTRASTPPGASIMVSAPDYGVATTSPVAPQPQLAPGPVDADNPQNWANVVPEQGVVVSSGPPGPVYAAAPPAYAPAPVYVQPAPIVYPAPVYAPAPVVYPPIGINLGFGYYHGWR